MRGRTAEADGRGVLDIILVDHEVARCVDPRRKRLCLLSIFAGLERSSSSMVLPSIELGVTKIYEP